MSIVLSVYRALGVDPLSWETPIGRAIFDHWWYGALFPAILGTMLVVGRRPGSVSSVVGCIRWRWLGACAARATLVVVLLVLARLWDLGGWQPERWPGMGTWAAAAGIALVGAPLEALGYQYFRGWLLQAFGAWIARPWIAAALATAVLVLAHGWPRNLALIAHDVIVGLAVCWLVLRTGGLEAAIGLSVVEKLAIDVVGHSQRFPDAPMPSMEMSPVALLVQLLPFTLATLVYTWWISRAARPLSAPAPSGFGSATRTD